MVSQTNERALENCIVTSLRERSRYEKGNPADFDREFSIDREKFWRFLETTQPKELEKLKDRPNYQSQVVNNQDEQNRRIALEQLIQQSISRERRRELDLYKRYASDPEFKRAFDATIMRVLANIDQQQINSL